MSQEKKNMTEVYFEWWLEELKKNGLVLEYEFEPEMFVLRNPVPIYYDQNYKTKSSLVKSFNLFRPITYTTDYRVVFDAKLLNKLFGVIFISDSKLLGDPNIKVGNVYQNTLFYGTEKSLTFVEGTNTPKTIELYFDVKPPSKALAFSNALGSSRDFKFNQRMVYDIYDIYVNKVIPIGSSNSLFNKTFTPKRYEYTDTGNGVRSKMLNANSKEISHLDEKYVRSLPVSQGKRGHKIKVPISKMKGFKNLKMYMESKGLFNEQIVMNL